MALFVAQGTFANTHSLVSLVSFSLLVVEDRSGPMEATSHITIFVLAGIYRYQLLFLLLPNFEKSLSIS